MNVSTISDIYKPTPFYDIFHYKTIEKDQLSTAVLISPYWAE